MVAKMTAYVFLCLSALLGPGALAAYMLFLYFGSPNLIDLGLSEPTALSLNACLCLAFFTQHSGMIRRPFRQWLEKYMKKAFHNAFYTIISGIILLILIVIWQQSSLTLATADGNLRWFPRAIFFMALAGMIWGSVAMGLNEPFGISPILQYLRGKDPHQSEHLIIAEHLIIRGLYRWVRHPLYLFSLLLIWSCPHLTADRLLFNILFTSWIIIGILLEERDLVANFGEEYLDYKRKVPMLIPYPWKKE